MKKSLETAPFKRDWLTFFSIGLFILALCGELMLIFWLPVQLKSETLWTREVSLQGMLTYLDDLRDDLDDLKSTSRRQEKELGMLREGVDGMARFIRVHAKAFNEDQIREIQGVLLECGESYNFFKAKKQYSREVEIDTRPCLEKIFAGLVPAVAKEPITEKK